MSGGRRVLIGFAGALSAPEVAWSLQAAGYEVHAFVRRGMHPPLIRCAQVELHELTTPAEDVEAALRELRALIQELSPAALMPLDDASVWLSAQLGELGSTVLVGPSGSQAELTLDKRLQIEAAAAGGLAVPPTRVCRGPEDALAEPVEFPVMVKPALAIQRNEATLGAGARRACADAAELTPALGRARPDAPFLLQPFIAGVGEGLFGIARDGEVEHWSAHRRVRMMSPQGSGSSACVSIPVDPELRDGAAAMLREVGWDGIFMVEMLRDGDGKAWFVELNGRAWGSMALARRQGLEYPAWAVDARLGGQLPAAPAGPPEEIVCRHLGRELIHLLMVLRGRPTEALTLWPSRLGTLRAVLTFRRRDRWYNLESGRGGLFVYDTVRTVGKEVARVLRP
jgi:predicted ATP-grasp superfamily ATP-dependent carboligase